VVGNGGVVGDVVLRTEITPFLQAAEERIA
jgi:hypothetical protein